MGVVPSILLQALRTTSASSEMERALRLKLEGGQFRDVAAEHRRLMQRVRGRGNRTTEGRLRAALVGAGIRGWCLHERSLYGQPDFYFHKHRVAVFVDGCFWHGCPECGHVPSKNTSYWRAKFGRNRRRDKKTKELLQQTGVRVVRFWEHEIQEQLPQCLQTIYKLTDGASRRRQKSTGRTLNGATV